MTVEFGIFGVGDLTRDPVSGIKVDQADRLKGLTRLAVHAEPLGFDVYAVGEHHNPPFVGSSSSTILSHIAAQTDRIMLSTSTTLITTNDPVKIAEDFATLQNLAGHRVDLMLGRGNTPAVYPWFGQRIDDGIALAVENYALLRRLWDEEVVNWQGQFRSPLTGFTSVPRPLDGVPPPVWHGSVRSPEIVQQAARYGDGFFVNNLFMTLDYFANYVQLYRELFERHGHGPAASAKVGVGGALFIAPTSQQAVTGYEPYFRSNPASSGMSYDHAMRRTGLVVGSPQQVLERILAFPDYFGAYRRQLFGLDFGGIPEQTLRDQMDLFGSDVLPVLRREMPTPPASPGRPVIAVGTALAGSPPPGWEDR